MDFLNVLIIRPAALGDTLMLLPSLVPLGETASVTLVGRAPGIHFLRPFARQCLDFESMGWHTVFTEDPRVSNLPHAEFVAVFLRGAEGPVRRNLQALFPPSRLFVFPGLPAEEEGVHAAFHLARCLQSVGLSLDPEGCVRRAESRPLLLDGHEPERKDVVLIHPGSGGRAKNHPPEFWLDLIMAMEGHPAFRGLRFRLLLGPSEEGIQPVFSEGLGRDWGGEIVSSPGAEDLLHLLSEGILYLGQDSGITHLAAMAGVPTIALFKVNTVSMWRPLGPNVKVILSPESDRKLASEVLEEAVRCL
jgi:heptosyltransferase III